MNYDSKRITISYPAIERLTQAYGLPSDLPSQTLAGYIERLIFECLCKLPISQGATASETIPQSASTSKPNLSKLAAMAKNNI
jgi:hypothetical protein